MAEARSAMGEGAVGALRRDASPEQLAAALVAAAEGLWVLDPGFGPAIFPAPAVLLEPLSPREQEVLLLLVEGLPNREIARRLFISAHTVKFHVNAILSKLDAATRTEAAVAAVRLGIVPR
jgi:DNA-binding NarL/FixJ family response regulator